MIILRRLLDNQILEIFSDKTGFIVQCNSEGKTNFLVSDYSKTNEIKLKHYTANNSLDFLKLEQSFKCDSIYFSECHITDNAYLVEQWGSYGGSIYNLDKKSKRFNMVYNDPNVNKFFDDHTLLVSEKMSAFTRADIKDTITYGINPETFEITTPIWSELQRRLINIYTKEQVEQLKQKLSKRGLILQRENLDEITIYFELEYYLNELAKYIAKPKSVYKSPFDKVNEEFIKQFVKK